MKKLLLVVLAVFLLLRGQSQTGSDNNFFAITAGYGMLIYQSAYNLQNSSAIEAAIRSRLAGPAEWQAGIRMGFDPVLPEVFGRVLFPQSIGVWRPEIGLEAGITGRAEFQDGAFLLRETRQAMATDIQAFYMAIHAAPLVFRLQDRWSISLLEVDAGTHFKHFGRTLRLQLTVVSAGMNF